MDGNNINQTGAYPDKPTIDKPAIATEHNSLLRNIGCLTVGVAFFIGAFYVIFDKLGINFILLLVLGSLIRLLGHFVAVKYFYYKEDVKMIFNPLLEMLLVDIKKEISRRQRAIILLARSVPGIIIGFILFFAFWTGGSDENIPMPVFVIFSLNVIHLLPFAPMDGWDLISLLFSNKRENAQIVGVILSAAVLALIFIYLESYWLLIIPFLLLGQIPRLYKIKKIKANLDKEGIEYDKPFDELTNMEYWLIREQLVSNMIVFNDVQPKEYTASKYEQEIIDKIKSLAVKIPGHDLSGKVKSLFVGIWLLFFISPVFLIPLGHYKSHLAEIDKNTKSLESLEEENELLEEQIKIFTEEVKRRYVPKIESTRRTGDEVEKINGNDVKNTNAIEQALSEINCYLDLKTFYQKRHHKITGELIELCTKEGLSDSQKLRLYVSKYNINLLYKNYLEEHL